ncbi:MAG: type II toxin-antitoxin system HicA family toxin [Candidatus Magasanikbacteria bacterium]|nr:type II toxin-antitoxin system HicA family toxin [Candidatus Magasanikbacteria bacterium]
MPKPYPLRLVVNVLKNRGFFFVSQTGSHAKYRKIGNPTLTVIVPIHGNEVRHGTFRSILRQAKLQEGDFRVGGII